MNFRGKELADAYQAKRDLEEKEKVGEGISTVHVSHYLFNFHFLAFFDLDFFFFCGRFTLKKKV